MAELVVSALASKILSTIASPAFKMAYEKRVFIWEAMEELDKLEGSMEAIRAVLPDAEKEQESSLVVRNWIKRLKSVFYDAEDLFDEIVTEDLLEQQVKEGKGMHFLKHKVLVSCSKLIPIVSKNSIVNRVKALRKRLAEISLNMTQFTRSSVEKPMYIEVRAETPCSFVDAKSVIGRDADKKIIMEMIINESDSARSGYPLVIAIVGIGGMGKTTLAKLIFNDEKITNTFKNRWFARISDKSDERVVLGDILQSITGESYRDLTVIQLQSKIRESIKGQKYLLVLDDVQEAHRAIWQNRLSLLKCDGNESRIVVTTRYPTVAKAFGAQKTHNLEGLSEDDSWSLFEKSTLNEYENDPQKESLRKHILKKCCGVPFAIVSIGRSLYLKNTNEWESIEGGNILDLLMISYAHMPSCLKECFGYCCLFPKDYVFCKRDLMNHWTAQGYIDSDEESSFMHLVEWGFFQQARAGGPGEIEGYKMHGLMHDLATYVSGEESVGWSTESSKASSLVRNVSLEIRAADESFDILTPVWNTLSLRSLLFFTTRSCSVESSNLNQLFGRVGLLRTLRLSGLGVDSIPPSLGELKFMRHLDLSHNSFEELPESVANLVNLMSLNLESCIRFRVWPLSFHKLISLRYLNFRGCDQLRLMPREMLKMSGLQYLSDFKTEKGNESLNAAAKLLQQLRDHLSIQVWGETESEDCNWQLPVCVYQLEILGFRGTRIPGWGDQGPLRLESLKLVGCTKVKYLPSLRCLPDLKSLLLEGLTELEFMEDEEDGSIFFPSLEELRLLGLANLRRWWRKVAAGATTVEFPRLHELLVNGCMQLEFESFPQCPQCPELQFRASGEPVS